MATSKSNKLIDALWDDKPVDVSTEVNFIWSIANKLRGPYQHEKFKDVIIPMTIIRRFECALEPYKKAVVDYVEKHPDPAEQRVFQISHFPFFNKSPLSLRELCNDADNIAANFREYIQGFSARVQEIIKSLDFDKQIDKMAKSNRLLSIVKAFSELDLDPRTIDSIKMGYVFEDLIRRFSENAEAGDHYTGRDIIKLMVVLLLAVGCEDLLTPGRVIPIEDEALGTGGIVSTFWNYLRHFFPEVEVELFGQEINPESYAICLAEMLIKGQDPSNIRLQDTMKADSFPHQKMRFVAENPPFGQAWAGKDAPEGSEDAVKAEYEKRSFGLENCRWPAGLPGGGDMQLLFVQSAMHKLADNGRAAIIENGSPLFTGGTASGESQIRRWLLENDYLEAIIALPKDLFYNTGIATYIWILAKKKVAERRGKVQFIDATTFFHPLRKSLGNKRNEISPEDRKRVLDLYLAFEDNEYSQVHPTTDFMYREYTVMQPLQRRYEITKESIERMLAAGALNGVYDSAKVAELEAAEELTAKDEKKLQQYRDNFGLFTDIKDALAEQVGKGLSSEDPKVFKGVLEKFFADWKIDLDGKTLDKMTDGMSRMDKTAKVQTDKRGNVLYDKETKDTEIVPYDEKVEDYMAREVLPHIPDAHWELDEKKETVGAEFPFTRYFYKYEVPRKAADILAEIRERQKVIADGFKELGK